MMSTVPAILVLLASLLSAVECKRILVIPLATHSHIQAFTGFGSQLVQRGHEVFIILNDNYTPPKSVHDAGIKVITYRCQAVLPRCGKSTEAQKQMTDSAIRGESTLKFGPKIQEALLDEMVSILKDEDMFGKMESLRFDIALVDGLPGFRQAVLIPHRLGLPFIFVSDWDLDNIFLLRLPLNPSYVPNQAVMFTENMNLLQRTGNYMLNWVTYFYSFALPLPEDVVSKYQEYGTFSSTAELSTKAILWLRTTDEVLDYIRPTAPNTINIGGIATRPAKPLPSEYQKFADDAKTGVILFTFGSMAESLPDELAIKFIEAFKNVKQNIIWRFDNSQGLSIPSNVMVTRWMPQNDLLSHPNVKIFITHSGNNGQYEALYHSVPMLGFSILGDQHYNCMRAEYRKFGICMSLFDFTSADLENNINKLLSDTIYKESIHKASRIFRSRKLTPVERATDMIEHALEFGGEHLRPYSLEMPLYQFLNFDVIALILTVKLIILYLIFKCLRCSCRKCYRKVKTE